MRPNVGGKPNDAESAATEHWEAGTARQPPEPESTRLRDRKGGWRFPLFCTLSVVAVISLCAYRIANDPRWQDPRKAKEVNRPTEIPKQPVAQASRPPNPLESLVPPEQAERKPDVGTAVDVLSATELPPATPVELLAEASQAMDSLVTTFADLPDVYELRARFFKWRGDSVEAVKCWEKCLELDPNYGHAYYGLGQVAAQQGKIDESAELFSKALAVMPNVPQVETELAKALINLDRNEQAVGLLNKRGAESALSPEAYCLLGEAYSQQDDYEKARESYQAAVQAHPGHSEAYFGLANALARLGQAELSGESMRKFQELRTKQMHVSKTERIEFQDLKAMGEDIAAIYINAGRIYFLRGKTSEAEKIWRRAAVLAPANVECRQALAWLYRQSNRLEETIQIFKQLMQIESNKNTYMLEIGRLRAKQGEFAEAEKTFRDLCKSSPNDPAGYEALAELYQRNGRQAEADQAMKRAAELGSDRRSPKLPISHAPN